MSDLELQSELRRPFWNFGMWGWKYVEKVMLVFVLTPDTQFHRNTSLLAFTMFLQCFYNVLLHWSPKKSKNTKKKKRPFSGGFCVKTCTNHVPGLKTAFPSILVKIQFFCVFFTPPSENGPCKHPSTPTRARKRSENDTKTTQTDAKSMPKWSQSDPEMTPKWPYFGPKRALYGPR